MMVHKSCFLDFYKACALGNDFVIFFDSLVSSDDLSTLAIKVSNRRYGIGCDQIIYVDSLDLKATVPIYNVRYFNVDGSEAEACGNGSRCVALLLMKHQQKNTLILRTKAGDLLCSSLDEHIFQKDSFFHHQYNVSVAIQNPTWSSDFEHQSIGKLSTPDAVIVNVGNPHLVCFVEDPTMVRELGPGLEHHPFFSHRTNVGFVQVIDRNYLKLCVWERGSGLTPACGTGACAAMVAASVRGLVDDTVVVEQAGGDLTIHWCKDSDNLTMQGPASITYQGTW
jgi:diaminopimelate epimerase